MSAERIINEFHDIYQNNGMNKDEILMIMLIDRLDRIAGAIDGVEQGIGCIDVDLDQIVESLSKLSNCVRWNSIYGISFYITGDVTT